MANHPNRNRGYPKEPAVTTQIADNRQREAEAWMRSPHGRAICRELMDHEWITHPKPAGRMAFHAGLLECDNPHLPGHHNHWEWARGWRQEYDHAAREFIA